ncbi:Protein IDA-LIKE 1, partial [Mucuna pruriens]
MANSHYSKSCKAFSLAILLVYLLLVGSCTAIRTGSTMRLNEGSELLRPKQQPRFPYKGLVFNFFPKGVPIPPSGPSKRHNSVSSKYRKTRLCSPQFLFVMLYTESK